MFTVFFWIVYLFFSLLSHGIAKSILKCKLKSAVATWSGSCSLQAGNSSLPFVCRGAEYVLSSQRRKRRSSGIAEHVGIGCNRKQYPDLILDARVAVILRGECPFHVKAQLAEKLGYQAAIIVNLPDLPPIEKAGFGEYHVGIPAVFIEQSEYAALNQLRNQPSTILNVNISLPTVAEAAGLLSGAWDAIDTHVHRRSQSAKTVVSNEAQYVHFDGYISESLACAQQIVELYQSHQNSSSKELLPIAIEANFFIADTIAKYAKEVDVNKVVECYLRAIELSDHQHLPSITNLADLLYKHRSDKFWSSAADQDQEYLKFRELAQNIAMEQSSKRIAILLQNRFEKIFGMDKSKLSLNFKLEKQFTLNGFPNSPIDNDKSCRYSLVSPSSSLCFPSDQRFPWTLSSQSANCRKPNNVEHQCESEEYEATPSRVDRYVEWMHYSDPVVFLQQCHGVLLAGPAGLPIELGIRSTATEGSVLVATIAMPSPDKLIPLHFLHQIEEELVDYIFGYFEWSIVKSDIHSCDKGISDASCDMYLVSGSVRRHNLVASADISQLPSGLDSVQASVTRNSNALMGITISGVQMSSDNYYHFMIQVLPRIVRTLKSIYQNLGSTVFDHRDDPVSTQIHKTVLNVSIILPGAVTTAGELVAIPFMMEALKLFGIQNNSVFKLPQCQTNLSIVTNLVISSPLSVIAVQSLLLIDWRFPVHSQGKGRSNGLELVAPRSLLVDLRDLIEYNMADQNCGVDLDLVIFISRRKGKVKARHRYWEAATLSSRSRHIVNEDSVVAAIRAALAENLSSCIAQQIDSSHSDSDSMHCNQFDVLVFHPEDHSLSETISLFRRAKVVVGAHGAGLTNIIFFRSSGGRALDSATDDGCRSNPALVEIGLPSPRLRDFQHLSAALDIAYWRVEAPADTSFETAINEINATTVSDTVIRALVHGKRASCS